MNYNLKELSSVSLVMSKCPALVMNDSFKGIKEIL